MKRVIFLTALFCVVAASASIAQEAVVTAPPPTFLDQALTVIVPAALLVIAALATWIAKKVSGFLNIKDETERQKFETNLRDTLHTAMEAGVKMMIAKKGVTLTPDAPPPPDIISGAVEYVKEKNPETIKKIGASDKVLKDIALSKIPDIIGQIAGGVGGPIVGNIAGAVAKGVAEAIDKGGGSRASGQPAAVDPAARAR